MKTVFRTLPLACLLVSSLAGGDVTGKWSGRVVPDSPGPPRAEPAFLILNQHGDKLTGSAGPAEHDQRPIEKGRVRGGKVSFAMTVEGQTMQFELTVEGDQMSGHVHGGDPSGPEQRLTITVKRVRAR